MNNQVNTIHPNAEVIKAWAEGKVIQWFNDEDKVWTDYDAHMDCYGPWSNSDDVWRIKPETKPDVVKYACVDTHCAIVGSAQEVTGNLKLTFDGETGKLKSAEVI